MVSSICPVRSWDLLPRGAGSREGRRASWWDVSRWVAGHLKEGDPKQSTRPYRRAARGSNAGREVWTGIG